MVKNSQIKFYLKNEFVPLINEEDSNSNTIPMYMDLKEL